ncbi:hypothetical protein PQS31_07915 [Luteimonas sp BLCC-B24]|nr:hypothetical protein [Luteimonas sp. BLCC-B24]MDC7806742.1 hypothetical protein [Luteimonas sp. BLCC-B24]
MSEHEDSRRAALAAREHRNRPARCGSLDAGLEKDVTAITADIGE